jgi:hypothetical protein
MFTAVVAVPVAFLIFKAVVPPAEKVQSPPPYAAATSLLFDVGPKI